MNTPARERVSRDCSENHTAPKARLAVGKADLCELLAATFSFPSSGELACALLDGSYASDLEGCLADAGASSEDARTARVSIETAFAAREANELSDRLRKGHSVLFLMPGNTPVWSYESAFRFAAAGHHEAPSLFRSPISLQVEAEMQVDGLLPGTTRTEPVDSIWCELGYMSALYGRQAAALGAGNDEGARYWENRARMFWERHAGMWLPDFMRHVAVKASSGQYAYGVEYAPLALVGGAALKRLGRRL